MLLSPPVPSCEMELSTSSKAAKCDSECENKCGIALHAMDKLNLEGH